MPKLRLLQGSARISRSVKIAKLTNSPMSMQEYNAKTGKLGILCLTNCDCKNDCSGMFAGLDTSTEKLCRTWCDKVKAKKTGQTPSKDGYWQQKQQALISADISATADEPAPDVFEPEKSGLENILENLFSGIFGSGDDTTYTPPPTPPPTPKIFGIPQNVALIGGALIIGGVIWQTTKKKKKKTA